MSCPLHPLHSSTGLGFHIRGTISEGCTALGRRGLDSRERSQGWAFLLSVVGYLVEPLPRDVLHGATEGRAL